MIWWLRLLPIYCKPERSERKGDLDTAEMGTERNYDLADYSLRGAGTVDDLSAQIMRRSRWKTGLAQSLQGLIATYL